MCDYIDCKNIAANQSKIMLDKVRNIGILLHSLRCLLIDFNKCNHNIENANCRTMQNVSMSSTILRLVKMYVLGTELTMKIQNQRRYPLVLHFNCWIAVRKLKNKYLWARFIEGTQLVLVLNFRLVKVIFTSYLTFW